MNSKALLNNLSTKLSILSEKVAIENSVADFSLNIFLENTFIKILNVTYDYALVNPNHIDKNFPAVDAIDTENGVMVQITSTFSKAKIEPYLTPTNVFS